MNRVVPGVLMAVAWLLLASGPAKLFALVFLHVAFFGLREYFGMMMPDLKGERKFLATCCALLPVLFAVYGSPVGVLAGFALALFGLLGMALVLYGRFDRLVDFLGISALATLYVGLGVASLLLLANTPDKTLWLILLVAITAGSDTGAYYAGRKFGKRKIFPLLSPKKTWAGLWGGLICGVVAAMLVHGVMDGPLGFFALLLGSASLVLVGVGGDLVESMLKRCCGVKDSGTILAGHGGILDRIDSMLLAAPALYIFLLFRGLVCVT